MRLYEFIGWMLGVWFAVLGGLFVSGVDVYGVLVSEYRFMGESGSVRLCEGLFSMPCIISLNPTK